MNRFQDPKYLLEQQYSTPANLDARIRLHALYSTSNIDMHAWLLQAAAARLPAGADVLEVGGGHGKLWAGRAGDVPAGWRITLTDFSPGMVAAARTSLGPEYGARIRCDQADVQALPFPDASFDAVCAHFMLYHVPDREQAYREISRVLRPGGLVFAATLGQGHLKEIYNLAKAFEDHRNPSHWDLPFRLENGMAELGGYFEDIELLRYADSLAITEAGPLVDYVVSMASMNVSDPVRIAALRDEIQAQLDRDGVIRVGKDSGLFIGRKAAAA